MILFLNPVVGKVLLASMIAAFFFIAGAILIHRLGLGMASTQRAPGVSPDALAAYESVIQRLRHQEQQLEVMRRAESDRAQASESISAAVLANLNSGVLLFNANGLVAQVNDAARRILDLTAPCGARARDAFRGVIEVRKETGESAGPAHFLAQAVDSTLQEGATFRRLEADYRTEAGENRILGLTISPVRRQDDAIIGAACLISDLTEVSRLTAETRFHENLAALGEMSAGMATQFQKSLALISSYAQKLTMEDDVAAARQFAFRITAESKKLSRTIGDFLEFTHPQSSHSEAIAIRSLLEDCARECNIDLVADSLEDDVVVSGDPAALRQAFLNLLRNSAEAARNGAQVRVVVRAEEDGERMRIVLRDNGVGIPSEHLSKVFVPFYTTKPEGTGLGLALVHRIVTQHGGTLHVTSGPSGTTFTISVPAARRARVAAMV